LINYADTYVYPVLLSATLTESEFEAVKAKAYYSEREGQWYLTQADVVVSCGCGMSKATRIRHQALDRLNREYPQGIPKPVAPQDPVKEILA